MFFIFRIFIFLQLLFFSCLLTIHVLNGEHLLIIPLLCFYTFLIVFMFFTCFYKYFFEFFVTIDYFKRDEIIFVNSTKISFIKIK